MEQENIKKIYMTWDDFDADIEEFSKVIKQYNFDSNSIILTLKRGAFTTSCKLSNVLDIPISVVAYQTRDGNHIMPQFLEREMITSETKIIIPDDIYDTGKTIETIIEYLMVVFNVPSENILGLFHYASNEITKTKLKQYYYSRKNEGSWVVLPWE